MGSVFLGILAFSAALISQVTADQRENLIISSKIVGGRPISIEDANFAVNVVVRSPNNEVSTCTAFLLAESLVATAGHCVPDKNNAKTVASISVYVGTTQIENRQKEGQRFGVKSFARHKRYIVFTSDSGDQFARWDVAVLKLNGKVKPGPKIGFLKLPKPGQEPKGGTELFQAGWGVYKVKNHPDEPSRKLRILKFKVAPRSECVKAHGQYKGKSVIADQQLCTSVGPKGAFCNGDSGGALYDEHRTVYGIVSSGACGHGQTNYDIYTNVAHPDIYNFIQEHMRHK